MGITLESKKGKISLDIGYGGFLMLRKKVAELCSTDFCLQSDCGGKIHYGACKEIYKHVKDYDDNVCYGYAGRPDCTMFKDFKNLLKECIDNKCDLIWW